MSKSWTNTSKCCATCANWGGPRELKHSTCVETESPGIRGKCYFGKGDAIPGPAAMGGNGCAQYQKWAALK